ncbi:MAG: DUF4394 domain-containing protein [Phycisphaerales bacterium]|nr:DUF4394 domain-containing protein [Phycisphaerales bacterium]
MAFSMKKWAVATVAGVLVAGGQAAQAELVYAITFDNNLFSFDSESPQNVLTGVYVSGLQPNEFIQGIDFRPLTNELYAIGSTNRMYVLNTTTGAATPVGSGPFTPPLNGVAFGVDFNPTVDRIRVHSNANQNLRLHPVTGAVVAVDPNLYYAASDSGAGQDPNIVASAYTNNFAGATTTTLFSIDSVRDVLVRHQLGSGDPAGSFAEMVTVGPLGVNFGDYSGFDISPSGQAYVHWNNAGGLFGTINLATGAVTSRGTMGGGPFVRDIAVVIPEPASLGLMGLAVGGLFVRRRR